MADAAQNASPAPAVATAGYPKSETLKSESHSPNITSTSTTAIKTEGTQTPKKHDLEPVPPKIASSGASSAGKATPTPPSEIPAPVKTEPVQSPTTSSLAYALSIAIPAATNGNVASFASTTAGAALPSSGAEATQSSVPAHMHHPIVPTPAISPLSDVAPTKRSRTPEVDEEASVEKRQKTEHNTEHTADQQASQDEEAKVESDVNSLLAWDLGAQLSSVLGAVDPEPANDAQSSAEDKMDTEPPVPLLPPPRKRLEKMKFIENPTYFSRAMGLPMLGSLSVQILLALFQQPSEVTDRQIRDVRTEGGKVYTALRETFMAVLKLFANATTFLSADDLDIYEPGDRETIQMANLASMCASFYGPGGPTMATAHDNFLKIMIPENGVITEEISALYLDQKTQSFLAYANVMEDKESTRNSLMEKFFPHDLEDKLKGYWRESNLAMPADEFVRPFTDRRNLLKAIGHDKEKRKALESKYQFASFLDNLSAFIRSNFDSILDYAESHGVEVPNEAGEEDLMLMDAQSTYAGSFPGQPRRSNGADTGYDSQGLASLIAEKLNGYEGYPFGYNPSSGSESGALPPSQTLPTSVLYERARQAAVAKTSAHARREGLQSTRRPWTPEEEKALMAGLDMVKGPHWSQILQLFGQNGTISDILKDRTQVQLKDKARNLKLFFLKTNSEMPYYLQCVTGELKTRAPSQALRKEAEEQARVQTGSSPGTYASTYMNGGTTNGTGPLAHGLPMTTGSPRPGSATPGAGPSTPVGASHAHPPTQPSYSQHQGHQQQQQSYQQQRPQQLQPAPGGAAPSQPSAPRPLQPQPQHQPIAPAPSYQRPLQQAPTALTPQYHQRPAQQPGAPTPVTYQQAQRPTAASAGSSIPPRTAPASTVQQIQPRPGVVQPPPAVPRAASGATAAPSRPASIPPPASSISPAGAAAPKGVPTVTPTPPPRTSTVPAPAPIRSAQQAPAHPPYPAAQNGAAKQPQSTPAPPVASSASVSASVKTPTLASAVTPSTPAAISAKAAVPGPSSAPNSTSAPAPALTPDTSAQSAESKEKADDDLLAKALKAAIGTA